MGLGMTEGERRVKVEEEEKEEKGRKSRKILKIRDETWDSILFYL